MTSKKTVSWSAVVNLGNDESLGLTVTGEAETPDEARDIFAFGIGQLIGTANSADEPTAALVRAYVSRLVTEEEAKPVIRDEKAPKVEVAEPRWKSKTTKSAYDKMRAERAEKQGPPESRPPKTPPTIAEQAKTAVAQIVKPPAAPDPAPSAPPKAEASAPAERLATPQSTASAPEGEICERCGCTTSRSQAKLSQLFMSKTLCKTCMEAP